MDIKYWKKYLKIGFLIVACVFLLAIFVCCSRKEETLYTATFYVDGEFYSQITSDGNGKIYLPDNPYKENHSFAGWFCDEQNRTRPFDVKTALAGNISLYAHFDYLYEYLNEFVFDVKANGNVIVTGVKNANITEIVIPNGVVEIAENAFSACTSLTKITLPDAKKSLTSLFGGTVPGTLEEVVLTGFSAVSNNVFDNCVGVKKITVTSPCERLDGYCFYDCSALEEIILPDTVKEIGGYAFGDCVALKKVELPRGVNQIGNYLFNGCGALEEVVLPTAITKLSEGCFCYCAKLNEIDIPENVTLIDDYAFGGCAALTEITIPENVTTMGARVFFGCTELRKVIFNATDCGRKDDKTESDGKTTFCDCNEFTELTIGKNVKKIPDSLFKGAPELRTITFGTDADGNCKIESIGKEAFKSCVKLLSFGMGTPETELSVGNGAFALCTALEIVILPEKTTKVGDNAFEGCEDLQAVILPNELRIVGKYAFYECKALKEIYFPKNITEMGVGALCGCVGLERITLPFVGSGEVETDVNKQTVFGYIFAESVAKGYYKYGETQNIPSALKNVCLNGKTVKNNGFINCVNIETVTMENTVKTIGSGAFGGCSELKSVSLSYNLVEIGASAFKGCVKLEETAIPETVEEIKGGAFKGCVKLERVALSTPAGWLKYYEYDRENTEETVEESLLDEPEKVADFLVNGLDENYVLGKRK